MRKHLQSIYDQTSLDNSKCTDALHWERLLNGNKASFEYIYKLYSPILFNYGYKLSQNKELTEDAIHDVFVYIALHKEKLSKPPSLKFYLLKSIRNEIIKKFSESKNIVKSYPIEKFDLEVIFSPEQAIIESQNEIIKHQHLAQTLNELPARQKEAIFLRFFEGLEYDQIAEIMKLDIKSAYKIIYKALNNLHHRLIIDFVFLIACTFLYYF